MRSLRRGTPLLLLTPVLAHYLHSVFFTVAAALRLGLNLLVQLPIFLNLQEFADVVRQETDRVALALPRRLYELFPKLCVELDFSFHIESPLRLIVLRTFRTRNHCRPISAHAEGDLSDLVLGERRIASFIVRNKQCSLALSGPLSAPAINASQARYRVVAPAFRYGVAHRHAPVRARFLRLA